MGLFGKKASPELLAQNRAETAPQLDVGKQNQMKIAAQIEQQQKVLEETCRQQAAGAAQLEDQRRRQFEYDEGLRTAKAQREQSQRLLDTEEAIQLKAMANQERFSALLERFEVVIAKWERMRNSPD